LDALLYFMIELGAVSEAEFVLAFVRGEVDAPRYRDGYHQGLLSLRRSRADLLDAPDLNADADNSDRVRLLGYVRGYCVNDRLFRGFPSDVAWRRCRVDLTEIGELLYANFHTLLDVSGPSRLVSDGAQRLTISAHGYSSETQQFVDGVLTVARRVNAGDQFEDLILLQDPASPHTVLLEGHTRATAYTLVNRPAAVDVLIGTSSRMHEWWLF
jgi:hypothetical protein